MAMIGVMAAIGEAIVEAIAAAEAASVAAGVSEGFVAAGEMAETTSFASNVVGMTEYEVGASTVNTASRLSAGGALMADPASAMGSYAFQAVAPEAFEAIGNAGASAGSGAYLAMAGETSAGSFGEGVAGTFGRTAARSAASGIPARLTANQARAAYKAFKDNAAKHGVHNPYADWRDFREHHHSGEGPFSPGRRDPPSAPKKRVHYDVQSTFGSLNQVVEAVRHKKRIKAPANVNSKMPKAKQLMPFRKTVTHRWSSPNPHVALVGTVDQARTPIMVNTVVNPGGSLAVPDTHEPIGYTQLSAMYDKYYVKEARVIVDYFNDEASAQTTYSGICIGITPKDDSALLGGNVAGHYQELPGSQWRVIGPEAAGRMTYVIKPNRFFGVSDKAVSASDKLVAASTDQPTDQLFLHLWAHRMDLGNADTVNIRYHVTMELDVVWMEPKELAQS